jgi:16S rRNA (guanine966-N2)-methyltransferase
LSIKILGGQLSGLSLYVPKGSQTRPTSVMLRRKIFDAHQNLSGMTFYDLCAGTGAMGLEALSRGAERVLFIENHAQALASIKQNIRLAESRLEKIGLSSQLELSKSKIENYLLQLKRDYISQNKDTRLNTILFLDPPYEKIEIYEFFLKEILLDDWFIGESWIESDNKKGLLTSWWEEQGVKARKIYKHGDSTLLITS